jgi:hypothetical protein
LCLQYREMVDNPVMDEGDNACYELRELPGRWLRRWPRRATCDVDEDIPVKEYWPVLQEHRWLWDD